MNERWLVRKHTGKVVPDQILCLGTSTLVLVAAGKEEVEGRMMYSLQGSCLSPQNRECLGR